MLALLLISCGPGAQAILAPRGELLITDDSLDFGAVPFGLLETRAVTLLNTGSAQLSVSASVGSSVFSVSQSTVSIGADTELQLTLGFQPAGAAPASGTLVLTAQDQELILGLSGSTDPDGDADGYEHSALGGADCDDQDPSVHPDAQEIWYDGVDSDCDGGSDYDADSDGYDSEAYGGLDCDDAEPRAKPGGTETWYDGIDGDCDGGSDYDADSDGYDSEAYGGLDCDDENPRTSPDATETWYDDLDSDCSGGSDHDADGDGFDALSTIGDDCDDAAATTYPGASEIDDGLDQDCDGRIDEDFVAAGDLVITELLLDPTVATLAQGQYAEVTNISTRDINLSNWDITGISGSGRASAAVVEAGGIAVICASSEPSDNGGLPCDADWGGGLVLDPAGDSVRLSLGGLSSDLLTWDGSWPAAVEGVSMSLDPGSWDADANDLRSRWCLSSSVSPTGDLGTPGALNDPCL